MSDKRKIYNYIKRTINPYGRPFEGTAYEFGLKIMDYIENMDDEKENGWIPVSERLPDPGKYVLVSFENFTLPMIGIYTVDDNGGTFRVDDEDDSFLEHNLYVNAWRGLPERYKEDEP
jgi:hypothetical protein